MKLKSQLKCIYCGASGVSLSDEHIIPYSLGGTWVLPAASCSDCSNITSRLERSISRRTYLPLRTKAGFPTYHPKKRPKSFQIVIFKEDGSRHEILVPVSKYPTIYPVLHMPQPGILSGAPLSDKNPEMSLSLEGSPSELDAFWAEYPDTLEFEVSLDISWGDLSRALAKIAHSFTIGHFGTVGYTSLLPQLILGSYPYLSHLVGGAIQTDNSRVSRSSDGLSLSVDPVGHIIVNIDIMGGRLPTYAAVAGVVTDWMVFMTNVVHISREDKPEYAHGMRTRFGFTLDWTIGIVNAIRGIVRRDFTELEPLWPLLAGFSFDVYALPPSHYLLVFKSTGDEVPSGPEGARLLPYADHPQLPPRIEDLDAWQKWVHARLNLPFDTWPLILPVHDSGRSNIDSDYELFTQEDKQFWDIQWDLLINAQLQQAQIAPCE